MTTLVYEVPLTPTPQIFSIALGGSNYNLTVKWNDQIESWFLDIADPSDEPIVAGIPLVTGADLLAQYAYLNFGGSLVVQSDDDPDAVPTFTNLGTTSHVYFVTRSQ